MQEQVSWIQIASNLVLVIITAAYVYVTKKTLDASIKQSKLAFSPVVGFTVEGISMG